MTFKDFWKEHTETAPVGTSREASAKRAWDVSRAEARKVIEFYGDENNFTIVGESGEFWWALRKAYGDASTVAKVYLKKNEE